MRHCACTSVASSRSAISFPESTFPLTSGSGYERLWDKAFSDNRILVIPVELRRRERVFQDGRLSRLIRVLFLFTKLSSFP